MNNISEIKLKLESEKARIESELGTIALNKSGTESWDAINTVVDESTDADPNEVADKIEEFETNQAISSSLKEELREINDAILKIEQGNYGKCEVCQKDIEPDRLDVNPSARNCKLHM